MASRSVSVALGVVFFLAAVCSPVSAQPVAGRFYEVWARSQPLDTEAFRTGRTVAPPFAEPAPLFAPAGGGRSTAFLVGGGLLGGMVGWGVGGAAGLMSGFIVSCVHSNWACGSGAAIGLLIGGVVGEAVVLPYGVHIADRRRGSYGQALLVSLAVAGGGAAIGWAMGGLNQPAGAPVLLSLLAAQIWASVHVERHTARR